MNKLETGKQKAANLLANPIRLGVVTIALTLVAFTAWAALAPLHGAVIGMGLVKAENSRKSVQHTDGGIIKAVHVRDGDAVKTGQPLLELDSVITDSSHRLLLELTAFEMVRHDRLDAEQQMLPDFRLKAANYARFDKELVDSAYARELKIFRVRRTSLDQQIATLREQMDAIEHEEKALRGEVAASRKSIELAQEELDINRRLYNEKFVSRARLLGLERAVSDYQAQLGEFEADLAQSVQRRNEVMLRIAGIRNDYQRVAAEEFKESSARLVEFREKLRPAEDALQRKVITAPTSGRVVGMRVHAPGEIAGPREVLMEIVPDEENLVIEAKVSLDHIKEMRVGQRADIRFTAYKSRTTPIVTGRLTYVSADALMDQAGSMPFYVVHIQPDPASLRRAGIEGLQPGMAAEVFVLTEARSTLDYLLSPVTDTIRRSLREK